MDSIDKAIRVINEEIELYERYITLLVNGESTYEYINCDVRITYDVYNGGMGYDRTSIDIPPKYKIEIKEKMCAHYSKKLDKLKSKLASLQDID